MNFTVTGLTFGGRVIVTNFFHDSTEYDTVFAYGPTPNNISSHWYELPFNGTAGEKLGAKGFTLVFLDGGLGDHDLKLDGEITTTLAAAFQLPPGPLLTLKSVSSSSVPILGITTTPNGSFVLATNEVPVVKSVLAWPASATNWFLQSSDGLSPTNIWQPTFDLPITLNNQNVLTNTAGSSARYYRLRQY